MARKVLHSLILLLLLAGCGRRVSITPTAVPLVSTAQTSAEPVLTSTPVPVATQVIETTSTVDVTHGMDMNEMGTGIPSAFAHNHLSPGPHLKVVSQPAPTEADRQRADELIDKARAALEKYREVKAAQADGYQVFAPEVPQEVYHFVNYRETLANYREFDPTRPTALLYKKVPEGWEFVGAMYSAPMSTSEAELDARFPISLGEWHAHVNICVPNNLTDLESLANDPRFGFDGSIATRQECDVAGGHFYSDILGWMVHVNLFEND